MGPTAVAGGVSPEEIASDPELAKLVERFAEIERNIELLKLQKLSTPEESYVGQLTQLLLDLADVTQKIEERGKR
jgi:hypothetical protein